jgi:hypothetical protein
VQYSSAVYDNHNHNCNELFIKRASIHTCMTCMELLSSITHGRLASMVFPTPSCPYVLLPQVYTRPFALRATVWLPPAATDTMGVCCSACTCRGEVWSSRVSCPSAPCLPCPHVHKRPSAERATLWSSPASIAMTPAYHSPAMIVGVSLNQHCECQPVAATHIVPRCC